MPEWGRTIGRKAIGSYHVKILEPRPASLVAVLDEAMKWGSREFIVFEDRRIAFDTFIEATGIVAERLQREGVHKGDVVLLNGANSPEFLLVFWAVLRLGAVVALANAWWSTDELYEATAALGLRVALADAKRGATMANDDRFKAMRLLSLESFAESLLVDAAKGRPSSPSWDEELPAVLIFTSGTTGKPKAAILSHRALIACLHNLYSFRGRMPQEMSPSDPQLNLFCCTPLFHVGGVLLQTQALLSGYRFVMLSGRADGTKLLETMQRERINILSTVPTILSRIIDHPDFHKYDLSSVTAISAAGAMVSPELISKARSRFPSTKLSSGSTYGMTESGGSVTMVGGPDHVRKPTSAGKPFPTCELRIADPDASGEGEILIRAASAMSGYWGRPEDNLVDSDGWIHSGDLGRIDDEGFLHVTGRSKDIIIRGGENMAASVIEDRLTEHPAVAEAAVLGLAHNELGEEVAAVVVLRPGLKLNSPELASFVSQKLAYFQVPTRWWLRHEPLPTNAVGKVIKPALRQQWPAGL